MLSCMLNLGAFLKLCVRLPIGSTIEPENKVMPVKIDNSSNSLSPTPPGEGKARAPVAKSGGAAPSTVASGVSTSVNLGTTSVQLSSMGGSVTNTPPVNATKVAEIKKAISEGRFQVNASAVADSLISSVTDLIASHQA